MYDPASETTKHSQACLDAKGRDTDSPLFGGGTGDYALNPADGSTEKDSGVGLGCGLGINRLLIAEAHLS